MNSIEKYTGQYNQINKELLVLQEKLKKHKAAFENKSQDWSFVGDLGYVLTQLKEINIFLGE